MNGFIGLKITLLRLLSICLSLFLVTSASAETHLRVGLFAFPPKDGNPFTGTTVPTILSIPAFYDGLTHIKRDGTFNPMLATAWRRDSDLVWSLDLRKGVSFSNGEPFDAQAVIAAFEYVATDEGKNTAVGREVAVVSRVEAQGRHSVVLMTSVPAPLLPRLMAAVRIPAPVHWRELGSVAASQAPVGTGPYIAEEWAAARVEPEANPNSWRAPKTDKLSLLLLPDQTARLQALQSGAIDIATSLGTHSSPS